MSTKPEDQVPPPDPGQEPGVPSAEPEGGAVTTEHLSELAEWLEARFDALDTRLGRFDQISSRNTRQFSDDMAHLRTDVAHLHERVGQLIAGQDRTLRDLLRAEISAALDKERCRMARAAWRRTLWTIAGLVLFTAGMIAAALVGLDILVLPVL